MTDTADTQDKGKRETRRDRIAKTIDAYLEQNDGILTPSKLADAVIAAYPEPHLPKEKDRKRGPNDLCTLFAMRHQFEDLCRLVASLPDKWRDHEYPGSIALAAALKEQAVVD